MVPKKKVVDEFGMDMDSNKKTKDGKKSKGKNAKETNKNNETEEAAVINGVKEGVDKKRPNDNEFSPIKGVDYNETQNPAQSQVISGKTMSTIVGTGENKDPKM